MVKGIHTNNRVLVNRNFTIIVLVENLKTGSIAVLYKLHLGPANEPFPMLPRHPDVSSSEHVGLLERREDTNPEATLSLQVDSVRSENGPASVQRGWISFHISMRAYSTLRMDPTEGNARVLMGANEIYN